MLTYITDSHIEKRIAEYEKRTKHEVALMIFTVAGESKLVDSNTNMKWIRDAETRSLLLPSFNLLGSYEDKVVLSSTTSVEQNMYGDATDKLGMFVCFSEGQAEHVLKMVKYNLSTLRWMLGIAI